MDNSKYFDLVNTFGLDKIKPIVYGSPKDATLFYYDENEDDGTILSYYKDNGDQSYSEEYGWSFCNNPEYSSKEPDERLYSLLEMKKFIENMK